MSFINELDITEQEEELAKLVKASKFECHVTTVFLARRGKVTLNFRRITSSGAAYSYLTVSWTHSFPQPFGFHVLPSGNWNVSDVSFGGSLFKKACRLNTAVELLENNKASYSVAAKAQLEKRVSELETEVKEKEAEVEQWKASALKAKAKLHELRDQIASAQQLFKDELPQIEVPTQAGPSTPTKPNDAIFKSWTGDGNVD
ncbi:hypothetical protein [Burdock mosaic virus]|nr:hypothetical protein [Burdock mosaic virus]